MTTPEALSSYYARKGWQQRGDEPTEAYSDDEGATDTRETRRGRRNAVRTVRALVEVVKGNVMSDEELSRGTIVSAGRPNGQGKVSVDIVNVPKATTETFVRARNISRPHETQLTVENIAYVDPHTKVANTTQGHRITFDINKLFQRMQDSEQYKRDIVLALIVLFLLVIVMTYIVKFYGPYLGF